MKKLAHRIKFGSIHTFHAEFKGLATSCDYKVSEKCHCDRINTIDYGDQVIQDQMVYGISDQVILADLLGKEKTDRTTAEVVEFIARKE